MLASSMMGSSNTLGMIVAAGPEAASRIEKHLSSRGEISYRIGEIVPGPRRVEYV